MHCLMDDCSDCRDRIQLRRYVSACLRPLIHDRLCVAILQSQPQSHLLVSLWVLNRRGSGGGQEGANKRAGGVQEGVRRGSGGVQKGANKRTDQHHTSTYEQSTYDCYKGTEILIACVVTPVLGPRDCCRNGRHTFLRTDRDGILTREKRDERV
eukprot:1181509-Prorocentrum_minimum.AAC.1